MMKARFSYHEINQLLQSGNIKQAEKQAGRNLTHSKTDSNVALMGEILLAARRYTETVDLIDGFFFEKRVTEREVPLTLKRIYFRALVMATGVAAAQARMPWTVWKMEDEQDMHSSLGDESRGMIFISGMPRSGTSTLGNIVGQMDGAVVYQELNATFMPYSKSFFDHNVLTRRIERNPHKEYNSKVHQRYSNAINIGDKRPYFQFVENYIEPAFDGVPVTILTLRRDSADVIDSYDRRAKNPLDSWPIYRDEKVAADEIAISNAYLDSGGRLKGSAVRSVDVIFEQLYSGCQGVLSLLEDIFGRDLSSGEVSRITSVYDRSSSKAKAT